MVMSPHLALPLRVFLALHLTYTLTHTHTSIQVLAAADTQSGIEVVSFLVGVWNHSEFN